MKRVFITTVALLVLLSMTALAATGQYDQQIQQAVSNRFMTQNNYRTYRHERRGRS